MKRRWKGRFTKPDKFSRLEKLESFFKIEPEFDSSDSSDEELPSADEDGLWRYGRRIIELGVLADQLRSCKYCFKPLHLHNVEIEQMVGYASILYISCECGCLNKVTTGKSHRQQSNKTKRGMPVYDINTKSALGMMHSGITHRQMNSVMATMEVQGLHHKTMKRRQEEVDPFIQEVANDSCVDVLNEESNNGSLPSEPSSGIFKYDMGWQKRGSGRAYDSKSGVGTLMGNNTGKICAFGIRISDCRQCQISKSQDNDKDHICHKNWTGSSKAMEPDVGVDLIKSIEKKGVKVSTLVMDDDTTTMARLRQDVDHDITKWSDTNHTSKHLTNSLFTLQKKHKCLSNSVIAYLKKCFNYALAQSKGDEQKCRANISQIVPHAFGEHVHCGDWCWYERDPEHYKHGSISKDLSGDELKKDLQAVFQVFSNNAAKLAPGGSTKEIESFNNMISSKAPKRCHFSASGNFKSRVGCAVAQKNLGNTYINTINEKIGLSPGRIYNSLAKSRDEERRRQLTYSNKKENKLRKLQNKLKKKSETACKEKKEGTSYKTAVAVTHDSIPPYRQPPTMTKLSSTCIGTSTLVFCDIETGSLSMDCDIIQLAACAEGKQFNEYIIPRKPISSAASKVTGLTSQGGVLFLNGSPVPAIPLKECLEQFIIWIQTIGSVVLVGHNFKTFDFPRILRAFKNTDLQSELLSCCYGGLDTLSLFRSIYPQMSCYKQDFLVDTLLHEKYSAHNALDDVLALRRLFEKANVSDSKIEEFSFSTTWGLNNIIFKEETEKNLQTLHSLVNSNTVSKQMATRIASSGLCYEHLLNAYSRDNINGIKNLFSDKYDKVVRVSSKKTVHQRVEHFFESIRIN